MKRSTKPHRAPEYGLQGPCNGKRVCIRTARVFLTAECCCSLVKLQTILLCFHPVMTNHLRSDDICVGDLLSGLHVYEIPAFQRDYSWNEQNAQRLLDDIVNACDIARESAEPLPFFLGTMLFVDSDEPASSIRSALVVDGQQRLITLTILVSVLRDQVAAEHKNQLHTHVAILTKAEPFEFDVFSRPAPCCRCPVS